MKKNYRPYTTYKGFGGVLAAFGLGFAITYSMDAVRGVSDFYLKPTLLALGIGCAGLYIFIKSEHMIKAAKACERDFEDDVPEINRAAKGPDWKGILITASIIMLYLLYIVLSAKGII